MEVFCSEIKSGLVRVIAQLEIGLDLLRDKDIFLNINNLIFLKYYLPPLPFRLYNDNRDFV